MVYPDHQSAVEGFESTYLELVWQRASSGLSRIWITGSTSASGTSTKQQTCVHIHLCSATLTSATGTSSLCQTAQCVYWIGPFRLFPAILRGYSCSMFYRYRWWHLFNNPPSSYYKNDGTHGWRERMYGTSWKSPWSYHYIHLWVSKQQKQGPVFVADCYPVYRIVTDPLWLTKRVENLDCIDMEPNNASKNPCVNPF